MLTLLQLGRFNDVWLLCIFHLWLDHRLPRCWCFFTLLMWTRTSEMGSAFLCRWRHLELQKKNWHYLPETLESLAYARTWWGDQEIVMFDGPFIQWSSSSELIDPLSTEVDDTNHDLVAFKFWVGLVSDWKDSFLFCPWGWWFSHKQKK